MPCSRKKKRKFRCPVVYKGKALMPMTWTRVNKLKKQGKGVLVKSKSLGWYFKLKMEPSGYETQDCVLGIDPGTKFNGYSVVTEGINNLNVQRNTERKDRIQKNNQLRLGYRRERRRRLRHRPCRNAFRNGKKVSKTTHYYCQVRAQMVKDICKLYPVNYIVIEDVKFNHYVSNKGASFSNIEIGKSYFKKALLPKVTKAEFIELNSYSAKERRLMYFSEDKKPKDKAEKSFFAHCFDAYCLANDYLQSGVLFNLRNYVTIIIEEKKRSMKSFRRRLREFTGRLGKSSLSYVKSLKGSKLTLVRRFHKKRKIRYKPDFQKSNHGPWTYEHNFEFNQCEYWKRSFIADYGYRGNPNRVRKSKDYNYLTSHFDRYLSYAIV